MFSTFAYEIGAAFLLAALLMYGTLSGFIPRTLRAGKSLPIFLAAALLLLAIYQFSPDLSAVWSSIRANAPDRVSTPPAPAVSASTPHPALPATPHEDVKKRPAPRWKSIVLDASVPPAIEPTAVTPEPAQISPPAAESSGSSPYDSKAKRAVKAVGRFFHIGRKKKSAEEMTGSQ